MSGLGIEGFGETELVGRGGFGSVYRAADEQHGRDVAIKVLDGSLGPDERRRFDRERQAMGRLGAHPSIVPVFDSGYTEEGRAYLVMEYASQGSLRQRLTEQGPLPWAEAVEIMAKVASGVDAAHQAGILHRDIKPDNILIDDFGNPKLADFGISTVTSGATTTKGASASLAHAAPELLEGKPASGAMDIYSLGTTLHTLISGLPPFIKKEDTAAAPMLLRILSDAPPDLRALGVPDSVATEVERSLSKDPAERHTSGAEFAASLSRAATAGEASLGQSSGPSMVTGGSATGGVLAASDPGVISLPESVPESGRPRVGKKALVAAGILGVAVLGAAAVGAIALLGGSNGSDQETVVAGISVTSETSVDGSAASSADSSTSDDATISISCGTEFELDVETVCSVETSNVEDGWWSIAGFTDGDVQLETVPGSNPIFIEPTNSELVGSRFTLVVTVVVDGDEVLSEKHFFTVVGPGEASDDPGATVTTAASVTTKSTSVSKPTATTAAPTTQAPTTPVPTTAPTTAAPTTAAPTSAAPTTAAPPAVSIRCPGTVALNTSIVCEIVSSNAVSGTWKLPGFFGGSVALDTVPGSNAIFLNPTNLDIVGNSYTISATVSNGAGQTASTSHSFTVTG